MTSNIFDPEAWKLAQLCIGHQAIFPTSISESVRTLDLYACTIPEIDLRPYPLLETIHIRSYYTPLRIYFPPNLKRFIISNTNEIIFMNPFPISMKTIMISRCAFPIPQLEHLQNLEHFHINTSRITELPRFPNYLKELYCSDLKLTTIPEFPPTLEIISIYNCPELHTLPFALPLALRKLKLANTRIEHIPAFPPYLTHIDMYDCQSKKLGPLPKGLLQLDVHQNELESIPDLPHTLKYLNIRDNPITYYPYISNKECKVYIDYNQLSAAFHDQVFTLNGRKVFTPLHRLYEVMDDTDMYMSDVFDDDATNRKTHTRLEIMFEIQNQYLCHLCIRTIKEELIIRTWHPSRIEAWCGVNFTRDDD